MAITFGQPSAPSQVTTNLDSLFATSLANYKKTLTDNIGAQNALLYDIIRGKQYESADGGTYLAEDLMYALTPASSYDGYDELDDTPTDGITQVLYEWRQMAAPITYSMKEVIQNKQRLVDLVKARIKQAEMGLQEGFAQQLMWGNAPGGGNIYDQKINPSNGSIGIEPLLRLIAYNQDALTVGNISASSNTWWRNKWKTSAAVTYSDLLQELMNLYNKCALGTGGPPTHIFCDQVTWELATRAYFKVFKNSDGKDNTYPFVWERFLQAKIIMDDKVPDAFSNAIGTQVGGETDSDTLTYGTAIVVNANFMKLRYQPGRDFEMLTDENGKAFQKPIKGDSRVAHVAWMGNLTVNNRRKHGVLAKIPRTLTD